jgi:hypothetical protein
LCGSFLCGLREWIGQAVEPDHIIPAALRLGKLKLDGSLLGRNLDPLDLSCWRRWLATTSD